MKIILSIFLLIYSFAINAQSLGLNDMVRMNKMSIDDFDTFITQKGFKYFKNENDDRKKSVSYIYESKQEYVTRYDYAINVKDITRVSYQTSNSSIYLKFKAELKKAGYIFQKNGADKFGSFIDYKKGKFEATLNSDTQGSDYSKITSYEISLSILR